MMAVSCDNILNLREWTPLTALFNKLPSKSQSGIFNCDVKVTCLDVLPEFLAIGTNLGVVYWYDRKTKNLQRLRCEKQNVSVTVVKIISTVDYMVACGSKDGSINIFQIPKSHPDSIPESLKPKGKQVERYTVSDLHKLPISAIEWSKNGMKLFSGDKSGCIVLTEIDFYMHICKSLEILNESYEVVQLSYNQQRLLVSTTYRSIICQKLDKWKVCQVGKKDRKILGNFGGIIHPNGPKASDSVIYSTRPGLRVWISDCEGNVNKTLLFKDLLCKQCPEVPIINPISKSAKLLQAQLEPSFGPVLPFGDNLILTYNNDVIYLLCPKKMAVVATMSHFRRVLSVATHKDEMFVLEEERSIIRIAYQPEQFQDAEFSFSPSLNSILPLTNPLRDLSHKFQSSSILPALSPFVEDIVSSDVSIHTDPYLIMNAEEAKESPVKSRNLNPEIEKKFNDIGKQHFDDKILFKQHRHKRKQSAMTASTSSLSSSSSEEKEASYVKASIMTLSSVGVLPDLRSPESIQNDIEYKEKLLADVLNLGKVTIEEREDCEAIKEVESVETIVPKVMPSENVGAIIMAPKPPRPKEPPACINIPNDWDLADVRLTSQVDTSLSDWEMV